MKLCSLTYNDVLPAGYLQCYWRLIKTHQDREGGGRELDCSLQWGETNAIERQEDDTENRQTFS